MADPVASELTGGLGTVALTTASFSAQAAGTLLLLHVSADDYRTTTGTGRPESTGWTLLAGQEGNLGAYVWYKLADGSETSVQYTIGSATRSAYAVTGVTNIDQSTPLGANTSSMSGVTENSNPWTSSSINPTGGSRWIAFQTGGTTGNATAGPYTESASYVEVHERYNTAGYRPGMVAASLVLDGGSATTTTFTPTGASDQRTAISAAWLNATAGETRDVMPVSFGAASSAWVAPASSVTVTPTYPADDNLDLIVATLAIKPNTATVATPANWAAGPNDAVGGGTQGAGTGACDGFVFTRVSDGSLSGGSQAFTITSGSSPVGVMHAWKYDSTGFTDPQWSAITSTIYSRTTGSTTFGGTGVADLHLEAGDVLGVLSISADDQSTTHTISAVAATGCTFGTVTQSPAGTIVNAQGNDISAAFAYATVLTGPSSSAPSATISGNTSETGGVVFYRIRATGIISAQDFTVTPTDSAGSTDTNAVDQGVGAVDSAGSTDPSVVSVGRGVTATDSAGATDTSVGSVGRGVTQVDSAGSVDTFTLTWGRALTSVDSAGSVDYAALTRGLAAADGAGSTDSLTLAWGRGVASEDNTGSTDSAVVVLTRTVTVEDGAGSTDSATLTLGRAVAPVDNAGATDSATLTWGYALTPADNAGSTDTAVVELARILTISTTDQSGSTDTAVVSRGLNVAATDTAGSTDSSSVVETQSVALTVTDSAGSVDGWDADYSHVLPYDDAGSTDSASVVVSSGLTVTTVDGAGSADSTLIVRGVGVAATDLSGSSDLFAVTQIDAVTDGAGSTDTAVVAPTKGVTATDPAGSTDQAALTRGVNAADSAGSTDYVAFTRGIAAEDSAGSQDTTVVQLVGAGFVIRTDDAGSSDTFTFALARGLTFTDGAGSTDTAGGAQAKPFTDLAGSTDTSVVSVGRGVTVTDGAGSTDFAALQRGVGATDAAGSADSASVALSGSGAVTATDPAGSSDSVTHTAVYSRPATDSAGSTDSANVALAGAGTVTSVDDAGSTDTAALTRGQAAIDSAGSTDLLPVISIGEALALVDSAGSSDSTIVTLTPTGIITTDDAGSTDTWTREAVYLLTIIDTAGATDVAVVTFTPFITSLDYVHASGALSTMSAAASLSTISGTATLTTVTASGALLP